MLLHSGCNEGLCQEILAEMSPAPNCRTQREQELKKEEHQPQAAGKLMRQLMSQKWSLRQDGSGTALKKTHLYTSESSTLGYLLGETRIKCKEQRPCSSKGHWTGRLGATGSRFLTFVFVFEMVSFWIIQTGLKILGSVNPPYLSLPSSCDYRFELLRV